MKKILGLLIFIQVNSEYLFYSEGFQQISDIQHESIYSFITKNIFPMNQNLIFQLNDTVENIDLMFKNEEAYLKENISKYKIDCFFIPNTIYELLVIHFWLNLKLMVPNNFNGFEIQESLLGFPRASILWKDKNNFLTSGKFDSVVRDITLKQMIVWGKDFENYDLSCIKTYELYNELNSLRQIKYLHFVINNEIIEYLKNRITFFEKISLSEWQNILDELLKEFEFYYNNVRFAFTGTEQEYYLCAEGITDKDLLKNIVKEEFEAHSKGEFLLYRGTSGFSGRSNKIDSTLTYRDGSVRANTISYGLSPFAAFFGNDAMYFGGAMAYSFLTKSNFSYLIKINKFEYFKNINGVKDLFHVPPLMVLSGLVSHSELFHARSMVAISDTAEPACGILTVNGVYFKLPMFLRIVKDKILHEENFSHYIVNHIVVLKNNLEFDNNWLFKNQLKKVDFSDYNNLEEADFSDLSWESHITP